MTAMKYLVVYERSENGVSAYVPDLPGCVAAASTYEATSRLIKEAIEFHLEGLRLSGDPIPKSTTVSEFVDVDAA